MKIKEVTKDKGKANYGCKPAGKKIELLLKKPNQTSKDKPQGETVSSHRRTSRQANKIMATVFSQFVKC